MSSTACVTFLILLLPAATTGECWLSDSVSTGTSTTLPRSPAQRRPFWTCGRREEKMTQLSATLWTRCVLWVVMMSLLCLNTNLKRGSDLHICLQANSQSECEDLNKQRIQFKCYSVSCRLHCCVFRSGQWTFLSDMRYCCRLMTWLTYGAHCGAKQWHCCMQICLFRIFTTFRLS